MDRKAVAAWEAGGAAFIILAGSALHFVFDWSGEWKPVAWLAAVNESTWEHFKLGFWPAVVFALFESPFLKGKSRNFWIGKTAVLWTMPIVIGAVFYGYKAAVGRHYLWADILLFVLAAVVGQAVSYRILTARPLGPGWRRLALFGLVFLLLAFAVLTYLPPRIFLFVDPRTGTVGLL